MPLKYYEYNAAQNKIRSMAIRFADSLVWHNPTMAANQEKDLKAYAATLRKAYEARRALDDADAEVRKMIEQEIADRREKLRIRRQLREEEKRREQLRITDG